MAVRWFEVCLVSPDPTMGGEIRKTRPCLVVSPDEMNRYIATVVVAPMTTKGKDCPAQVSWSFKGKSGQVVFDRIRTVDKARLVQKLGVLSPEVQADVLSVVAELFAP